MSMPPLLPVIKPEIPVGYRFIAVTLRDPAAPLAIMGWPTIRRDVAGGPEYSYPITPENVAARIKQENLDVLSWRVIEYEDIPEDRTYRDALTDDGTKLKHDMPKAREIHRNHMRYARIHVLTALDIEYQRADEQADAAAKARIAAKKQALRDLPASPEIEAATTTDDLKAFWPEALK